jgi:hypothetical protein
MNMNLPNEIILIESNFIQKEDWLVEMDGSGGFVRDYQNVVFKTDLGEISVDFTLNVWGDENKMETVIDIDSIYIEGDWVRNPGIDLIGLLKTKIKGIF